MNGPLASIQQSPIEKFLSEIETFESEIGHCELLPVPLQKKWARKVRDTVNIIAKVVLFVKDFEPSLLSQIDSKDKRIEELEAELKEARGATHETKK